MQGSTIKLVYEIWSVKDGCLAWYMLSYVFSKKGSMSLP